MSLGIIGSIIGAAFLAILAAFGYGKVTKSKAAADVAAAGQKQAEAERDAAEARTQTAEVNQAAADANAQVAASGLAAAKERSDVANSIAAAGDDQYDDLVRKWSSDAGNAPSAVPGTGAQGGDSGKGG